MRKYYFLLLSFFVFAISSAQESKSDYVITLKKDTIFGTVSTKNIFKNKRLKVQVSDKSLKFRPTELKEVQYSGAKYVRLKTLRHKKIDTVHIGNFVTPLDVTGAIKVYGLNNGLFLRKNYLLFPIKQLRFHASDYDSTTVFLRNKSFQNDSIIKFVHGYNSFKKNNPESQSFADRNIHFKKFFNPQIAINFQGLLPSYHYAGIEFGLYDNITFSTRLSILSGRLKDDGKLQFLPFSEFMLKVYPFNKKRVLLKRPTYKYSGANFSFTYMNGLREDMSNGIRMEIGLIDHSFNNFYIDLNAGILYIVASKQYAFWSNIGFGYSF